MANVAVIGSGMFGLVCALRLSERGDSVTIFERDTVPGGLAAGFQPVEHADYLERFYHHIFKTDVHIRRLIDEVGLSDRLEWSHPITACLCGDTIAALDSAAALLAFSPLPVVDRIRLGAAMAMLKIAGDPQRYESVRAQSWLRTIAGGRAHDTVFRPLFEAKFGRYAEDVTLSWFWARIHDRTSQLGYLRGGFNALYTALAARVAERGGALRFDDSVQAIARRSAGLEVRTQKGFCGGYDRVIAGMPLRALATIAPDLPADFVSRYSEGRGFAARCVILALDRQLSANYWVNVCERAAPFTVLVEHTNISPPERYGGRHLVYLGNYGEKFEPRPIEELLAEFAPWIRRVNPEFEPAWVTKSWQFIAADAQPVVTIGYRDRIAPHRTPVEGLFVGNLFQVYPHDRGQNYAAELAENLIKELDS